MSPQPGDRHRRDDLENENGPTLMRRAGPRNRSSGGLSPCSSERTLCGDWLACASMLVPACCRMLYFVNLVISAAMSTSRIRDSEAVRFSW